MELSWIGFVTWRTKIWNEDWSDLGIDEKKSNESWCMQNSVYL